MPTAVGAMTPPDFGRSENPGEIEIRDKLYKSLMYCHQYCFSGTYDQIKLHKQIIHQNDGISMRNLLKPSPPAFSNENDIAVHGICFDFYYWPKPSQIGQNGSAAAADARLAE